MLMRRKSFNFKGELFFILKMLLSGKALEGPSITEFETAFKSSIGSKYGSLTSTGIESFKIILEFYKFDKNRPIIIPSYTAAVVKELLERMEITFLVADIDPKRAVVTTETLKNLKDHKVAHGILVTHLLGNMVDIDLIEYCKSIGLVIIEDCAHAHGGELAGKPAGRLSNASFYSFGPSKLMNNFSGGILLTDEENLHSYALKTIAQNRLPTYPYLFKRLLFAYIENIIGSKISTFFFKFLFKNNDVLKKIKDTLNVFGRSDKKPRDYRKYSNLQASAGLIQLRILNQTLNQRRSIISDVKSKLMGKYKFLESRKGDTPYNFIVDVDNALEFRQKLYHMNIDAGCGRSIMEAMGEPSNYPGLKYAYTRYVQLPCHHKMNQKDVDYLSEAMVQIIESGS